MKYWNINNYKSFTSRKVAESFSLFSISMFICGNEFPLTAMPRHIQNLTLPLHPPFCSAVPLLQPYVIHATIFGRYFNSDVLKPLGILMLLASSCPIFNLTTLLIKEEGHTVTVANFYLFMVCFIPVMADQLVMKASLYGEQNWSRVEKGKWIRKNAYFSVTWYFTFSHWYASFSSLGLQVGVLNKLDLVSHIHIWIKHDTQIAANYLRQLL